MYNISWWRKRGKTKKPHSVQLEKINKQITNVEQKVKNNWINNHIHKHTHTHKHIYGERKRGGIIIIITISSNYGRIKFIQSMLTWIEKEPIG